MNSIRGSTLPETAIMLAIALLLLLGIIQLELIGWSQASAQGAAFVAAHQVSINPQGSTAADQAYAQSIIANAFPNVLPGELTLSHPNGASVQVVVSKNPGGLLFVPGASATVGISAADIEPMYLELSPPPPSPYGVLAKLKNYCTATTCDPTHNLYLAQYDDLGGKGNGKNGQFGEWKCRPALFYNFPNSMPTTPGGIYDPASPNFVEKDLYSFDSQSALWGQQPSC